MTAVAAAVGILGLGQWLPDTVRANDAWPAAFVSDSSGRAKSELADVRTNKNGDAIDRIVARWVEEEGADPFFAGVERRVANADAACHAVEIEAGLAALRDAKLGGDAIDVVVSVPSLPDRIALSPATAVAKGVGATRAFGFGLDGACASSMVALDIAMSYVESGRARNVLLTQSHLLTRAHPMMHPLSPNLGDGATAMVIGRVEHGGIRATRVVSHGEYYDAVGLRRRPGDDAPWWEAGGPIALGAYDGEKARKLVQDTVRIGATTVREVLDRANTTIEDIDVFASVQPRRWVPHAIAEAVGLPSRTVVETFQRLAHLGPCGPVANLVEARQRGMLEPGKRALIYAQGAGFTRAAAVIEWS